MFSDLAKRADDGRRFAGVLPQYDPFIRARLRPVVGDELFRNPPIWFREKPKFPTMLKHACLQMNNISENFFVEAEILLFFTGHNLIIAASFNHLNYKK